MSKLNFKLVVEYQKEKPMKKIVSLFILAFTVNFAFAETPTEDTLVREELIIVIPGDVKRDYELFVSGRDPLEIKDYSGLGSRRDVVEVVLIQQALALGGITEPIRFLPALCRKGRGPAGPGIQPVHVQWPGLQSGIRR